jgi:hypothetical protein
VFIEYTNNQLTIQANNRLWGNFLLNQLPKYASVMDRQDIWFLFNKSPIKVIQSLNTSLWSRVKFFTGGKTNFIAEENWGGFITNNNVFGKEKIDSFVKAEENRDALIKNNYSVADKNLYYLAKTIKMCQDHHVKVYLLRSPMPAYVKHFNEATFHEILQNEFEGIPFVDLKDFKLSNNDYCDPKHLNYQGSKKISVFLNQIINEGTMDKSNYEELIKKQIELSSNTP